MSPAIAQQKCQQGSDLVLATWQRDSQVDFSPGQSCEDQSTITREIMSASELGKAPHSTWNVAEAQNHCELHEYPQEMPLFRNFVNEIKIPCSVFDEKFICSISDLNTQMYTHIGLANDPRCDPPWARSLLGDETQDGDPYNLGCWRYALYSHWSFLVMAIHDEANNKTEIRSGSDYLFQLAFQLQSRWKHYVKSERDLFLPASPHTTTADIIALMPLPDDWSAHLELLDNSYIFASELKLGNVVTFAYKAECNNTGAAQQQLALCLCSAQHQRQALGFNNGPIFGATVVGNKLEMYSSIWKNGKVIVYPLRQKFTLNTFPAFLRCYIFLCMVADYVGNEMDKVFKEWDTEDGRLKFQKRSQEACIRPPWRCETTIEPDLSYLDGGSNSPKDTMEFLD